MRYNGNKFSVYESEEKTVLGLLGELGSQVNHNTDNLKNKTDLYGDHKGSWQGLSRPTLSEEGMRATVEDIIDNKIPSIQSSLETIITKNTEINVLDYGLKGNGEVEDLTRLKGLLANKLTNVTLYFPSNKTYKINEPITIKSRTAKIILRLFFLIIYISRLKAIQIFLYIITSHKSRHNTYSRCSHIYCFSGIFR